MGEPTKQHIAMFPWLAFGHMIPYLELAKLIAKRGHKISFISTPRNIHRLPKLPPNLAPEIDFVALNLPSVDNLPHDAEATMDLPSDKVPYLKVAYDGLQDSLSQFLEANMPDWIIYDFSPHWLPDIAARLGISRALFTIFPAWAITFIAPSTSAMIDGQDSRTEPGHFIVSPEWVPFPSTVAFRLYEAKQLSNHYEVNDSGASDMFRFGSAIAGCEVIALRNCLELIGADHLKLLEELHRKPVLPLGLLLPSGNIGDKADSSSSRDSQDTMKWTAINEWLEKQKKGSVVYIAFGSELNLSQEELSELAFGLELSGLPFFWALRKGYGSAELPDGFEDRIKGRGLVWKSWVPQLNILAHDSVGGILTHCGWSSVIEALHFGRVLILLPFVLDQGLNARVYEEMEVGIEILRSEEDGSFTRNVVAETLRLLMVEEEGHIYRDKAKEMMSIFGDRELHDRYIDDFVDYLQNHRQHRAREGFN